MDGNSRWAKKNNISKKKGYLKGLNNIYNIVENCIEKKIKYLTLFALSSENIKRPSINIIYEIMQKNFSEFVHKISNDERIKINIVGDKENIPIKIKKILFELEKLTKDNNKINVNIAFNYGSSNELIYLINNFIEVKKTNKNIIINEKTIKKNMYLSNIPDPDILIRTGGFNRLSNFLLLHLSYTELFFSKILWPDFKKKDLNHIIKKFQKIERKYGL
mgnify:CR=1 FL=1